jgi:hypothetical protein
MLAREAMDNLIYCSARDKDFAQIAIDNGWLYGAQLPNAVHFPPVFTDQDWKRPDRERYVAAVALHRPRWATVLDFEHVGQYGDVIGWAEDVAPFVSDAVIVIPKAFRTIDSIPHVIGGKRVVLGYSVPTKFGGTSVPYHEFGRRPVHLLGGSPKAQFNVARFLNVVSVDGSWARKIANQFAEGITPSFARVRPGDRHEAFAISCRSIRQRWQMFNKTGAL